MGVKHSTVVVVADDGTSPVGTDEWNADHTIDTFALPGDISPTQLAANTDDWAPTGLSTAAVIRVTTDASRNLTGLTGGADGRVVLLVNVGSFDLVLKHDVTSTAANRFYCNSGADQTMPPTSYVMLLYDSTSSRWRVSPIAYGLPTVAAFGDAATAGTVATHRHGMPTARATTSGLTAATATVLGRASAATGAVEEIATTGTGSAVMATSPTLVTPALGTPASGVGTNLTGIPESGVTNLVTDLAAKAPLASPTFTGTITVPLLTLTGPFGIGSAAVISPTQISANTDNWNPTGLSTATLIRITSDAARNLTGISYSGSGSVPGRVLWLHNAGSFTITLKFNVTSSAGNKFLAANSADVLLRSFGTVMLVHDSTGNNAWIVLGP